MNGYTNGYIERRKDGRYEGEIDVEGVDLSPIVGTLFKKGDSTYLWLRRKDLLEYDEKTEKYVNRKREPRWEAYLKKQMDGNVIAYMGEFVFMHFKFSIKGVWDSVLGYSNNRMNFYVERMPMSKQTIINNINERKRKEAKG